MTTDVDTVEVPDVTVDGAPQIEVPTLKVADRCDVGQCGAQAWVITAHLSGFLYWCAHHYGAHHGLLDDLKVLDNRQMINTKPSPTS